MMRTIFISSLLAVYLMSCTTDISVDIPNPDPRIVVEGNIEPGEPPFVLLTRNQPFFGGFDLNDLESYFVRDAQVTVWTRTDTVQLTEWCIDDFPEETQGDIAESLGYSFDDSIEIPNICLYSISDLIDWASGDTASMVGEVNQAYWLRIDADGEILTSKTTIPGLVPLDSLSYRPHPDPDVDSLVTVYCHFTEPDTVGNFLRYWTQRNSEPEYLPRSQSVFDDLLFNGQTLALPIERGQESDDIDFDNYSYFWKGDTVTVKWSTIDKAHYDFWLTLENDEGDSPFSSATTIKTNIEGGLGIWGGYGSTYTTIIIPED